jgi:threonine dehydrogenase-like Zn-dependent dehydrogenase
LAIQVLKRHFGVGLVTAIDRNQARLQLAATLGADVVINSALGSTTLEDLGREHQDHYADYVFDALPHTFTEAPEVDVRKLAMGLLRPGGTYAIYGATGIPQLFSTWLILAKGLRVVATPFDVRLFPMRRTAHVARVALDLLRQRLIQAQPIVTAQLDFFNEHAVRSAFEHYGEGSAMKTSISRFGSITPYLDIDENRLSA